MTDSKSAEAPLPPETRAVLARARRSFLFSMALLIVGLIAVGVAIVYKTGAGGPAQPVIGGDYGLAAVQVPAGAEVLSAVAAGGDVTVTYRSGGNTAIRIFDGRTGALVREIAVTTE